jgi:hypothetical protein
MFDHLFDQTEAGSIQGMHEAWTIVSAVAASTERVEIAPSCSVRASGARD